MGGNPMNILMQLMSSGNPQMAMQNIISKNPQFNAVLNQQKQSGMSMEQYVRNIAQQNNIDLNPMLNFLRQKGVKI